MSFSDPLFKILLASSFHTLGIAPVNTWGDDVNKVLSCLPPEEARRARRKFRKLWRAAVRHPPKGVSRKFLSQLGYGTPKPNKSMRRYRKALVHAQVTQKIRRLAVEAGRNS